MKTVASVPAPLSTTRGGGIRAGRTPCSRRRPHSCSKRILVPYNGSPTAEVAVDLAADWCRSLDAELWVIFVRPYTTCRGIRYFLITHKESLRIAQHGVSRLRRGGVPASGVVRSASRLTVSAAIAREADDMSACAIVIGSRHPRPINAIVLGSIFHGVVRRTNRPVILAKASGTEDEMTSPNAFRGTVTTRAVIP